MAAYAALVSAMNIIDNLQLQPRPPISLHKQQAHLLTQKLTFLQEFLEVYNPNLPYTTEADPLETRIASVAYAAEDAIESHIAKQFSNDGEKTNSGGLYEALEKVIEDMAFIEKEAMSIKETMEFKIQLNAKSTPPSSSIAQKKSIGTVGLLGVDGLRLELMNVLTSYSRDLQVIPIVGMDGLGKSTLALNVYHDSLIREHFDIRAWVNISQEHSIRKILLQILTQLINVSNQGSSEGKLGEMLHKHLCGKKFMIVFDDMWSLDAWNGIRSFFPDNNNGSRVVVTTRLTNLASSLNKSYSLGMKLLDGDDSWDLLSKIVFGEEGSCPFGFEIIGKKIAKSCVGLPQSIVVVGGILAKSEQTMEFWKNMEDNLNAIVNLEDGERHLRTLHMSYKYLPVHLKPCFLYVGIYCEDCVIRTSKLVRLWVAEGFIKPVSGKRLEDVARAYLMDLIDRNLIGIHKLGKTGGVKECKVYDLFRDLCTREAKNEGFYTVYSRREIKHKVSRALIPGTIPADIEEIYALSPLPLARSLILDVDVHQEISPEILRLLRIVESNARSGQLLDNMYQLVNSRFFAFTVRDTEFPSLIWQFWNLQTLIVRQYEMERFIAPNDIWYMSHIRHLYFNNLCLPDAPSDVQDGIVLENLQTLATVRDFTCSEEVVVRIPNIRKLKIVYMEEVDERYRLANLECLDKLESLACSFNEPVCQMNYPQSLKKLSLRLGSSQGLQDIVDKIGALPLLQKLKLTYGTFKGKWETTEGRFRSLRFLSLNWCQGLQVWTSKSSHFPQLQQLHLYGLDDLEEIPSDFGHLPTLRLIVLELCADSAVKSAKRISNEQRAVYVWKEETTLQIQVMLSEDNDPTLESLGSPTFHVTLLPF